MTSTIPDSSADPLLGLVLVMWSAWPSSANVTLGLSLAARWMRGFKRIHLAAGETQTVTFALDGQALTYWDKAKQRFALESGMVDVMVGASSGDIRQTGSLMTHP